MVLENTYEGRKRVTRVRSRVMVGVQTLWYYTVLRKADTSPCHIVFLLEVD